jgi:hypothetical protein
MPDGRNPGHRHPARARRPVPLRVTDTGIGMAEGVRRRIFEPLFSTKGEAGPGLAMAYSNVMRHGALAPTRWVHLALVPNDLHVRLPALRTLQLEDHLSGHHLVDVVGQSPVTFRAAHLGLDCHAIPALPDPRSVRFHRVTHRGPPRGPISHYPLSTARQSATGGQASS